MRGRLLISHRTAEDCDRARAEMCIPLWAGRRCHTKADCVTLDPHCNAGVVECDHNACVDGCQVPHRGMAVALRGPDSAKVLQQSIHGELFDHFMYEWLDRGFTASGRSTFSKAKFQFVNTLHRKHNEDIAMVKSKHQLLPLYEEVLKPAANDGGAVLKVSHEGVLQMDIVQKLLISDVLHVVGAVAVVFLTIWSHTGSLFVTAMGMFHVLLAFPSAYTFYTLVLGFEWMPLLNYIGIFVAVGIGADDIFVYTDAWAQGAVLLPPDCPLSDRIAWTLQRAGSAMFLTSFTTSMAFLTNVVNSVVPMQLFGIFMALMVFFDYIYTVTWFPCAVTVYHTYIEHNPRFNLRQACGCGRRAKLGVQDGGGGAEFSNLETAAETTSPVTSTSTPGVDDGLRWVERVFRDRLSPPIYKARQPIIAAVAIFTLPMAYWMFSLQLDEGGIQPFPLWHNQRKAMDIDAAGRLIWAHPPSFHHRGMGVQVLFGVPAQDTGSRWNKTDRGRLDFDDAFDLDDPAAQAWLLQTAQQAHREPFIVPQYFGFSYNITSALRDGGGGGGGGGGDLGNSSRAWEGSCNSSLKLAFDSEVSTSWVPTLCEAVDRAGARDDAQPAGSSGGTIIIDDHVGGGGGIALPPPPPPPIVVLELTLLAGGNHDVQACKDHPAFCLLLDPKLVGHVDLAWTKNLSPSSYLLEAAVRAGEWRTLANVSGLDTRRSPSSDSIDVGYTPVSFLRLSFPLRPGGGGGGGGGVSLAEISVRGDAPTVVELVDMVSRALPAEVPCGGGLPLRPTVQQSFGLCAGFLARLRSDRLTGNVTGVPGGLLFRTRDARCVRRPWRPFLFGGLSD
jgi:hypothetical protein